MNNNKNIDEIDKLFLNYFNSNVEVPDIIENGIKNVKLESIKQEKKIIFLIKKIIITILGIATITGGTVFAENIGDLFKNFFGANSNEGIDSAVKNGYIANLNTNYKKSDGIDIKIDSMLMDDVNLCLNFIVTLDNNYDIDEFTANEISFDDLKIVDETGKVIFITHPYDSKHQFLGSYTFDKYLIGERTFRVSFIANDYSNLFPRSKKLFINFNILNSNTYTTEEGIKNNLYNGEWNFELEVPKEFYNRETTIYKVQNTNIEQLNGVEALLTNTTFKIYISEMVTEKIEYLSTENRDLFSEWKPFKKIYVETSNGTKFEGVYGMEGTSTYGVPFNENKIINYQQTFNLTSFDSTDILKVHMITNKNQEIIIELEKNN